MDERDSARQKSGDYYIECSRRHMHWGGFGAAGILVVVDGRSLLVKRSMATHHGGTWSVPGGAIKDGEDPLDAALRELSEETGLTLGANFELVVRHDNNHGQWAYYTHVVRSRVIGEATLGWETDELLWLLPEEVDELGRRRLLHPDFNETWPSLRSAVLR